MHNQSTLPHSGAPPANDDVVTLQFRHDQQHSGISRHGQLRPRGRLRIEYDPARLSGVSPAAINAVVCHIQFRPSEETASGSLSPDIRRSQTHGPLIRPLTMETSIPPGTTSMQMWFEALGTGGTIGWDSRFGSNYKFVVAEEGLPLPERSITIRDGAVIDGDRIRVVEDDASKQQVSLGASGTRLRTGLVVRVRIEKPSKATTSWADVHVFDATGEFLHGGTIALEAVEPLAPDVELRYWDAEVYPGSGGGSGVGVWSRPDAHAIQYRLYCDIDGQVFTDGVLHQFDLLADTDVRPIPGGW